ncbi:MAG TPA: hypothetical protein VM659_21615 [Dongiaceae bacterium]|nr:hypothetical protein [Dongiaceae bacterium]
MRKKNAPTLVDWAVIRTTPTEYPEHSRYHFTGVGLGHPRLSDGMQIITTEIQEIGASREWGRTKSRVYNLLRHVGRDEFTSEVASTVKDILFQELRHTFDVEWVSIEDWLRTKSGEGSTAQEEDQT